LISIKTYIFFLIQNPTDLAIRLNYELISNNIYIYFLIQN